jgi:hypothetical protein
VLSWPPAQADLQRLQPIDGTTQFDTMLTMNPVEHPSDV